MSAQVPCFLKLTDDVRFDKLGKVWCGVPCFLKLKIVQTLFTKQMAFRKNIKNDDILKTGCDYDQHYTLA